MLVLGQVSAEIGLHLYPVLSEMQDLLPVSIFSVLDERRQRA